MDNEIKINLTIELPGSQMLSKEECLKTTQKEITKKSKSGKIYKKTIEVQVEDWDKCDNNTLRVTDSQSKKSEVITFHTRKNKPAAQTIKICKEAYDYMTSRECPEWSKIGVWNQMKPIQRLELHLKRIAESLGGVVASYEVFED